MCRHIKFLSWTTLQGKLEIVLSLTSNVCRNCRFPISSGSWEICVHYNLKYLNWYKFPRCLRLLVCEMLQSSKSSTCKTRQLPGASTWATEEVKTTTDLACCNKLLVAWATMSLSLLFGRDNLRNVFDGDGLSIPLSTVTKFSSLGKERIRSSTISCMRQLFTMPIEFCIQWRTQLLVKTRAKIQR